MLEELFFQNFPKGKIVGPFDIICIMQNKMEFAQAGSGAKGTRVEKYVPTCGLQHLVSWK